MSNTPDVGGLKHLSALDTFLVPATNSSSVSTTLEKLSVTNFYSSLLSYFDKVQEVHHKPSKES